MKPLSRNEVPAASTWNLADLFPTTDAWRAELADIEASVSSVTRHQGKLGEGPATLLACLDARDAMQARLQRVWAFASLRQSEDGTDPARQADAALAAATYARVDAAMKFVDNEILDLPDGKVAAWLEDEPLLQVHRTELDDLMELKPHMLSAETERVLASFGVVLVVLFLVFVCVLLCVLCFVFFVVAGE